jgi:putative addiction module killer protein
MVPRVLQTDVFASWLDGLRDLRARARIQVRIERLIAGNPGDVEPIGEGVSELRIDYGPGYRVYFKQRGRELVILLAGGSKATQSADIKTALRLAREL